MARTSEPDFLQTETRAGAKGQAIAKARGGGSRVAGELAAAADSDQAARQLHWPAAHTRIPFHTPKDFSCQDELRTHATAQSSQNRE